MEGKRGCEEEGTSPPSHSRRPRSRWHPEQSCHGHPLLVMLTGRELPSPCSPHQQHPQGHSSTSPGQKGVRRSWGQPQAPPGMEGVTGTVAQSRGGRHWESLYLICSSLFKNKLRSSGRREVGGDACAGGGQAARKTTLQRSPCARKKAVEHPRG